MAPFPWVKTHGYSDWTTLWSRTGETISSVATDEEGNVYIVCGGGISKSPKQIGAIPRINVPFLAFAPQLAVVLMSASVVVLAVGPIEMARMALREPADDD